VRSVAAVEKQVLRAISGPVEQFDGYTLALAEAPDDTEAAQSESGTGATKGVIGQLNLVHRVCRDMANKTCLVTLLRALRSGMAHADELVAVRAAVESVEKQ